MSLSFIPLIVGLLYLKLNRTLVGISCIAVFVLTIVLFIVFVMSEEEKRRVIPTIRKEETI